MNGSSLPSNTVTIASSSSANPSRPRRPDERAPFAIPAHSHQVRLVQPSAEVTDLPGCIHRRGRLAGQEVGLHARQQQQEPMRPALPDTLKQMFGTAEPTHALRLVASRNVEYPETEGNPRGVGRTESATRASHATASSLEHPRPARATTPRRRRPRGHRR